MKSKLSWLVLGLVAGSAGVALLQKQRSLHAGHWRKNMTSSFHRTALVTGASSGIGETYARRMASLGYDLVLVARRVDRLEALAADLQDQFGCAVEVLPADLSTEEGISIVEERISAHNDIDFLVNNAGYSTHGPFSDTPIAETLALINCHIIASVRLARAALPGMLARNRGAIVNVSSVAAFIGGSVNYASSKAYLIPFSEALQMELAGTQVRVQALCPGFTRTEFHDRPEFVAVNYRERIPGWAWSTSEEVVTASLKCLTEDRVICVPGWKYRLVVALTRTGLVGILRSLAHMFYRR